MFKLPGDDLQKLTEGSVHLFAEDEAGRNKPSAGLISTADWHQTGKGSTGVIWKHKFHLFKQEEMLSQFLGLRCLTPHLPLPSHHIQQPAFLSLGLSDTQGGFLYFRVSSLSYGGIF